MKVQGMVVAVALTGFASYAAAQSSVTLYGSLGDSVGYVSNEHGGRLFGMSGGYMPEWFGITGTEDLGGGTKAIFKLENGLHTATGAGLIAGDMFSRMAYVGLQQDGIGRVTLGRQSDLTNDMLMPLANGLMIGYQMYHPANLDNYAFTSWNNAVKVTSMPWHGFTASAMYAFDDASTQAGRYAGAGVSYANGPLKAAVVYSAQHDRTLALGTQLGFTEFAGQPLSPAGTTVARSVQIVAGNAMYDFNSTWTLRGGYSQVGVEAQNGQRVTMRTGELGTYIHTGPANLISAGGDWTSFAGAHYLSLGASDIYSLSKRTNLFASVSYQHASNAVAAMPSLAPSSTSSQVAAYMGMQLFF